MTDLEFAARECEATADAYETMAKDAAAGKQPAYIETECLVAMGALRAVAARIRSLEWARQDPRNAGVTR